MPPRPARIRVSTTKVDHLINLVGELVITQSMLSRFADGCSPNELEKLREGLTQLTRNTRELQESVMQIRMLPISFAFNRFPRLVHDLSRKLGKKVELKLSGEGTELDKTVLEKIADPLVHLVRNALDHGLEKPEVRLAAGKPETGTIELAAFHEGGNIIIEVKDDGGGLNKAKILQRARERGLVAAGRRAVRRPDSQPDLRGRLLDRRRRSATCPAAASAWTSCAATSRISAATCRSPRPRATAARSASACR